MLELNNTYCGDCLELMKWIPDGSVDMVLCDLPYGTTQNKWDSVIPFDVLWGQYRRVLRLAGCVVLSAMQPFTSAVVCSNLPWFKYEWIWEKEAGTGFLTNEGDTVLDNCCGSGTTGVACARTNRNFIQMDLSEEYCGIAVRRYDDEIAKLEVEKLKKLEASAGV